MENRCLARFRRPLSKSLVEVAELTSRGRRDWRSQSASLIIGVEVIGLRDARGEGVVEGAGYGVSEPQGMVVGDS